MPPSITIKIDFGSENVTGTTNNVSLQGNIPTPFGSLSVVSGATLGQSGSGDAAPTPFGNLSQGLGGGNDQTPTPFSGGAGLIDLTGSVPSPSMEPVGNIGKEDEAAQPEDAPGSSKKSKK